MAKVQVMPETEYTGWKFSVERGQGRLKETEVIMKQFTFFWYGVPSIDGTYAYASQRTYSLAEHVRSL